MNVTIATADILAQATSIFNAFSGVLVVAVGISLGTVLLSRVKRLF